MVYIDRDNLLFLLVCDTTSDLHIWYLYLEEERRCSLMVLMNVSVVCQYCIIIILLS